jgi:superfamily II DNA/RNA helicase
MRDAQMRLHKHNYACLSLHGGKDQNDRDDTLALFKNKGCVAEYRVRAV